MGRAALVVSPMVQPNVPPNVPPLLEKMPRMKNLAEYSERLEYLKMLLLL